MLHPQIGTNPSSLTKMQKYSCKNCSCLKLCYVASAKGVQHGAGSPHCRDWCSARLQIKKVVNSKYNVFQETLVALTGRKIPLNSSKLHKLSCVCYRQLKEQSYRNSMKYCFRCHTSNKTIMVS